MNSKPNFERRYRSSLRKFLREGAGNLQNGTALGRDAAAGGKEMLEVARVHERALKGLEAEPGFHLTSELVRKGSLFFREVITVIEANHPGPRKAATRLSKLIETLDRRTVQLMASKRHLKMETARRAEIEAALKQSERHYTRLLEDSASLQEQLRHLSRLILAGQEEERKRISRELHDQVAASLTGINLELAGLRNAAAGKDKMLKGIIARTQRKVYNSVQVIHDFARDLRPAVLDDLGLVPALNSLIKTFRTQTKLKILLKSRGEFAQLDNEKQTVLYRVAQEALSNVIKHARATQVEINLRAGPDVVTLLVRDNGKSFQADRLAFNPRRRRLGLIGMRERVEMVGGNFRVESSRGKGTTIHASVPAVQPLRGQAKVPTNENRNHPRAN